MLGIGFTVAKLDAQGRKAEAFPHVTRTDFERWQKWTVSIYRLGSSMCFVRVLFHQGWALYLARHPVSGPAAPASFRYAALGVDVLFLLILTATFIRSSRARQLRRELGIVLSPVSPQHAAAVAPEVESDAALQAKSD